MVFMGTNGYSHSSAATAVVAKYNSATYENNNFIFCVVYNTRTHTHTQLKKN